MHKDHILLHSGQSFDQSANQNHLHHNQDSSSHHEREEEHNKSPHDNKVPSSWGLLNSRSTSNEFQSINSKITNLREARTRRLTNEFLSERESSLSKLQNSYEVLDMIKRGWEATKEDFPTHFISFNQKLMKKQELLERSNSLLKKNQNDQTYQKFSPFKDKIASHYDLPQDSNYSLASTPNNLNHNRRQLSYDPFNQDNLHINTEGFTEIKPENNPRKSALSNQSSKITFKSYSSPKNGMNFNSKRIDSSSPKLDELRVKVRHGKSPNIKEPSSTSKLFKIQEIANNSKPYPTSTISFEKRKPKKTNRLSSYASNQQVHTSNYRDFSRVENHSAEKATKSRSQTNRDSSSIIPNSSKISQDLADSPFTTPIRQRKTLTKGTNQQAIVINLHGNDNIRKSKSTINLTPTMQTHSNRNSVTSKKLNSVDSPRSVHTISAKKINFLSENIERKDENMIVEIGKFSPNKELQIIEESICSKETEIMPKVELKTYLQEKRAMMKKIKQAIQGNHENLNSQLKKLTNNLLPNKDFNNQVEMARCYRRESENDSEIKEILTKRKTNNRRGTNKWLKEKENIHLVPESKSLNTSITPQKLTQKGLKSGSNIKAMGIAINKNIIKQEKNLPSHLLNERKQPHSMASNAKPELLNPLKPSQVNNLRGWTKPKTANQLVKRGTVSSTASQIAQNDNLQRQNISSRHRILYSINESSNNTNALMEFPNVLAVHPDQCPLLPLKSHRNSEISGYNEESSQRNELSNDARLKRSPIRAQFSSNKNCKKDSGSKSNCKDLTPLRKKSQSSITSEYNDNYSNVLNRERSTNGCYIPPVKCEISSNARRKSLNPVDQLYDQICSQLTKEMINMHQNQYLDGAN